MKRYLLLASVAGCLLSAGNAWAASTSGSGENIQANLDAKVTVQRICTLEGTQDLEFGTVVLSPEWNGGSVATLNYRGEWSPESSTGIVSTESAGSDNLKVGLVTYDCSGYGATGSGGINWVITTDETEHSGVTLSDFTSSDGLGTIKSGAVDETELTFGATLNLAEDVAAGNHTIDSAITVQIAY